MANNYSELVSSIREQIKQTKTKMFEASFTRLKQHTDQAKDSGFAILTSWRQPPKDLIDPEELKTWKQTQKQNFEQIKGSVRKAGYGFIQLRGHWRECEDITVSYEDCPEEKLTDAIEPVLMVPKIDLESAKLLGQQYNQDAILYAGPETNGVVNLVFRDGSTLTLGNFSPQTLGQAYTEFRTKSSKSTRAPRYFRFEGLTVPANSYIEALVDQSYSETIKILSEGLETNEHELKNKPNK